MIIGNGLIANAFQYSQLNFDNYIIFASGVSNSHEEDEKKFEREKELILKYENNNKKFIYFSSIHLLDPSQLNLRYVKHKIEIEKLIQNKFENYIIYRLPIVMGSGGNEKSLFNFLFNKIKNKEKMEIHIQSFRYIIGVDDVVSFVFKTLHANKEIINLVFNKAFNILEIIKAFEIFLNTKSIYTSIDKGAFFSISNKELKNYIDVCIDINHYSDNSYLDALVQKYYSKIIEINKKNNEVIDLLIKGSESLNIQKSVRVINKYSSKDIDV